MNEHEHRWRVPVVRKTTTREARVEQLKRRRADEVALREEEAEIRLGKREEREARVASRIRE